MASASLADPQRFFRVLAIVQLVAGVTEPLLSLSGDGGAVILLRFFGVVAMLACVVLAAGWAALTSDPLARMASSVLALGVIIKPWPFVPELVTTVAHTIGIGLLAWSMAPSLSRSALAAVPIVGVVLMFVADLLYLGWELSGLGDVLHHLGLALVAWRVSVRTPEVQPVVWRIMVMGSRRVAFAEMLRLGLVVSTVALALLAFIARVPSLMVLIFIGNLATIILLSLGAFELRAAGGAAAVWLGASIALGMVALGYGALELMNLVERPDLPAWVPVARVVAQNGMAMTAALGLGALLDRRSPKRHHGDAQRCAVTYTTVLALMVVQTSFVSGELWPIGLAVGLASVVVLVIAASSMRRLAAEVELLARDQTQAGTFDG